MMSAVKDHLHIFGSSLLQNHLPRLHPKETNPQARCSACSPTKAMATNSTSSSSSCPGFLLPRAPTLVGGPWTCNACKRSLGASAVQVLLHLSMDHGQHLQVNGSLESWQQYSSDRSLDATLSPRVSSAMCLIGSRRVRCRHIHLIAQLIWGPIGRKSCCILSFWRLKSPPKYQRQNRAIIIVIIKADESYLFSGRQEGNLTILNIVSELGQSR